jgi:hypothetical protein
MIRGLIDRINAAGHRTTKFMERMHSLETVGALLFIVSMFCFGWAFAWYAHIIGPWVDQLMGWGPHSIDSPRKIQWRRMWATAVCLPGILLAIYLYIRGRRHR